MSQRPFFLFFILVTRCLCYGQAPPATPPVKDVNTIVATCSNPNGEIQVILDGTAPCMVTLSGGGLLAPLTVTTSNDTAVFKNLYGGSFTYTLVATDATGNSVTLHPLVGNLASPTIVSMTPTPASCLNNDANLKVTVSGGTPAFMVGINSQQPGGSFNDNFTLGGLASGLTTLTVIDRNACVATGSVVIPLNNNLTLTTNDATICQGAATTLAVTSNASTYAWSPAVGLSSVSVAEPVASPSSTTTYTLSASLGPCMVTGTSVVTVLPAPVPDAGGPTDTTCYGKAIQLQGSGGVKYQWTPSAGLSDATAADPVVERPTANFTYSLSVVGANGCPSLMASKVTVVVRSPYKIFAGNDTSVVLGQPVPLSAVDIQGVGFSQYQWSPSVGLSNPDIADPVASFSEVGSYVYVVTAVGPEGCEATDSIDVKVYALADIFVPNAFTPNHDGHNDVLRALPVSIKDFKYLSVFNRWGQQVFTTTNFGVGWDGTFNGHEAPTGVYVWMAGGVDYTGRVVERKGTVILIR